jgi:hypothetical protein
MNSVGGVIGLPITNHPLGALRLLRAAYCLVKLFLFSRNQRIDSRVIDKLS